MVTSSFSPVLTNKSKVMARQTLAVVETLRKTAVSIEKSADYQWGHMGSCNCGFLVQEITHLNKREIHQSAMERYGDWNEQLNDYCPTSGMKMDAIISAMLEFGFDTDDLKHLERLADPTVLRTLPPSMRNLRKNNKADVALYLRAWADLIENSILDQVRVEDYFARTVPQLAEAVDA